LYGLFIIRSEGDSMSANNAILITKRNNAVSMIDVDTNYVYESYGEFKTLEEALAKANEIMSQELVEYNIIFRNK
jgi:hypothetical protein